jgi:RimJ/RimL family protein N-acetyltransferase
MLKEALDEVFASTNLNKLYCQTASFNAPSVRLLTALGSHLDGTLREHHELDGVLYDDYIYSVLRREWVRE